MAAFGAAVSAALPAPLDVSAYLAPSVGTNLGPAVPVRFGFPEITPPDDGQMWPRGDYNPS